MHFPSNSHNFPVRDYYDILNVPRNAKKREIRKAFRNLSKQHHPDKTGQDTSAQQILINNAYQVLIDDDKRKKYDKYGEEGLRDMPDHDHSGFSDFFGDFGFFGGQKQKRPKMQKGGSIYLNLEVTLEDLCNGNYIEFTRIKSVIEETHGTRKCNCRQEMKTTQIGFGSYQMFQQEVCDECPNIKMVPYNKELEIEIDPGMKDGDEYPFFGEGEPHVEGSCGDLIFVIKEKKHPIYTRRGNDLHTNCTLTLEEALNGFNITIYHLDGHPILLSRNKITWYGARIKRSGQGMPLESDINKRGDMYVHFDVEFPRGEFNDAKKLEIKNIMSTIEYERKSNIFHNGF
ncbi:DnaJ domain protein 20 [Intoshia linei]|uniref:DnaJ domain protein 20 n=1 Tax=Intoshia linei TaxID=1819745 RepID=A0A177B2K5_9BILA|nr:DnaJ domain protein 20 [Intoshia linei]